MRSNSHGYNSYNAGDNFAWRSTKNVNARTKIHERSESLADSARVVCASVCVYVCVYVCVCVCGVCVLHHRSYVMRAYNRTLLNNY